MAGLALALSMASPVVGGATTVAFDSFGSDDAFDLGAGGLVGPGPTGVVELGLVFTAQASGQIASLTVPMSSTAPPSVATFVLYEWTGTSRGPQVDLAPARVPGGTPEVIEIEGWTSGVTAGSQYALFATSTTASVWKASLSPAGRMVYVIGGAQGDEPGWSAAARIELEPVGAPAPVPLPATLPLIAAAIGALAFASRRRAR